VTANVSSSSVASRPEARVDLSAARLLPPLPEAWLAGRDLDLLDPLRFLPPGGLPATPALVGARRELAAELAVTNGSYGNQNAERLARRLADPATRIVVTGQQPGLFGGPLYSVSKAIAASRWAAALEAAGEPAVAVFWMATEDHDWAEVSSAVVLTPEGPRELSLGPDPEPLAPAGMRSLGPEIDNVLRQMVEAVPGDRYAEWLRTLARWYRPRARFGEAYSRLLAHLLGPHCPLILDSMLPSLKAAQRPWLRRLVERRETVEEVIATREGEIQGRGYPLQVTPQRGASPLFLLHRGQRRKISWRGPDCFVLRGNEDCFGGPEDLLRIIDENPGVVSPGVLARPAVQDAVLGTCLQVLGPGELSYMAQAASVHEVLEVDPAWVSLRPQALVLESHQIDKLAEIGLTLADVLGDQHRLDRRLAERSGGDFVAPVRSRVEGALDELRAPALAADPNLERPFDKTREQILRALDLFSDKAVAAAARKNEVADRRVRQLRDTALPLGKPQERVVSSAHFQGKYGDRFAESFWEQMELDPAHLQVISP
jgi:bacillithiol biosynthesis cysteine-adding enzyme BshC